MKKKNNIYYEPLWHAARTGKSFNLCQVLDSMNWKKLSVISDQQQKQKDAICWRHLSAVNTLQEHPVQYQTLRTLAVHWHSDVCRVAVAILQGAERPGSVYSTMPQWWHAMVLQYIAASFHLPSVFTDNINTVQYTKPYSNRNTKNLSSSYIHGSASWQPLFITTTVSSLMTLVLRKKQM